MKFDEIVNKIKNNYENTKKGYYNCIPFMGFDRLGKVIPGVEQSTYYLITANSGVGKSRLTRQFFINSPLQFYNEVGKELGINLKIFYFSFEESKEKIILYLISDFLYNKYKLRLGVKQLLSIGKFNVIDPNIIPKIMEAKETVEKFLSIVSIEDKIRNNVGIYHTVRNWCLTQGSYVDKDGNKLDNRKISGNSSERDEEEFKKIDRFEYDNPLTYVIVLKDHVALLDKNKGESLHSTISEMSSKYDLKLRDRFGASIVNVQQQSSASEVQQFTNKGQSILGKIEPSASKLGDCTLTQRDANIIIGLYGPTRHGLKEHRGYIIDSADENDLGKNYRSILVLKNRDGIDSASIGTYFKGDVGRFYELPKSSEIDYEQINKKYG